MSEELMPCPFCGGEVSVVVLDDEGNIRDEEYERDPYSGLSYAVAHDNPNGACPIATYDEPLPWLYDSRDGVAHVWNRRAERTWHDFSDELPPGGSSVLCRGKNGALYVGKPVMFVDGTRTREVWVPRGNQYRMPEKWMEIEDAD